MNERQEQQPRSDVPEHKRPPHERRYLNGVELWTSTCPSCHAEVLTLIREFKGGKVVRVYCHKCPEPVDPTKSNRELIG